MWVWRWRTSSNFKLKLSRVGNQHLILLSSKCGWAVDRVSLRHLIQSQKLLRRSAVHTRQFRRSCRACHFVRRCRARRWFLIGQPSFVRSRMRQTIIFPVHIGAQQVIPTKATEARIHRRVRSYHGFEGLSIPESRPMSCSLKNKLGIQKLRP